MGRIAIVKREKCNYEQCGTLLCQRFCPVNRAGDECIIDSQGKAGIIEEQCIGCGICIKKCPTDAITIINTPGLWEKTPIHRYGQNGFRVFNLPAPIFSKVVGVIGRNGIGKSTALSVLGNMLAPNFGEYDKQIDEIDFKSLIEFFKGTEAQGYFEQLRDGKIKISYKPQAVEMIPKQFKGTVKTLLEKVDVNGKIDQVCEDLELSRFLDRGVDQISGGELQRVAIAAAILRDANTIFFDELSNFLDIKQRIKVARYVKSLASPELSLMVIEHDLIILDYMTDLIHIMYGREGAYGMVSMTKTTRSGINEYMSGFLREENVRFRENKIDFGGSPPELREQDMVLVEWPKIEKKLGDFTLRAEKGIIHRHDVIGILGENGIGKSSFVKELATHLSENEDNEGEGGKVKVAFKPQYLDRTDEPVATALKDALQYGVQLMEPLNLKGLLKSTLKELSGGELQRVMIAKTLATEADLFLLDEPSANLDVEQRLIVSKVIRDMMELKGKAALIIDHDILFIDYIASKLIVFEGEPAVQGKATGPHTMEHGMNLFLQDLNITMRRDHESRRPRINKEDSQLDKKQKADGKLYYN